MTVKRTCLWCLALGAMVAFLWRAGPGWACVPQPVVSLSPSSFGPAGSQVTIQGLRFGGGPVEVRWNGLDGQRLGDTGGTQFSLPVTIPAAPEGLYVLTVLSRGNDGVVADNAVVPFQVVDPGALSKGPSASATPIRRSTTGVSSATTTILLVLATALGIVGGGTAGALTAHRRSSRAPGT
ncbi:MAG: hypothetical protein M3256_19720 [Actinomycetota bacterium]|nr:hypothetical protein [Actinomycetota bacterium]